MKKRIESIVASALSSSQKTGLLPETTDTDLGVDRPQDTKRGDFASTISLKLAKPMRMNPIAIAEILVSQIPPSSDFSDVSISKPGFINFTLSPAWLASQVEVILTAGDKYGHTNIGNGERVQIEFVSVNPTGPIHVGHARGAVFGSALAEILKAAGYQVECEYYLNDAGSQMENFNLSLYARYCQLLGEECDMPEKGYVGEYVIELAQTVIDKDGSKFKLMPKPQGVEELGKLGLKAMVDAIQRDMAELQISYDVWFSELSLYDDGKFDTVMTLLRDKCHLLEKEGATWFNSTAFGDHDDRVLIRGSGAPTYLASDAAYHYDKFFVRKFDKVINIWGADHQGQVKSMKALMQAMEADPDRLTLLLYQLVTIKQGSEVTRLSKRAGKIATLRELVNEVGPDACRFFFLSRTPDTHMEFDLDLATKESSENPVYYVQYAHARISGIFRQATKTKLDYADGNTALLNDEAELALIRKILEFPDLIEKMAQNLEPHHLTHYSIELATTLQKFYERCRVVSTNSNQLGISKARLKLVKAAQLTLSKSLSLMLMTAPEQM